MLALLQITEPMPVRVRVAPLLMAGKCGKNAVPVRVATLLMEPVWIRREQGRELTRILRAAGADCSSEDREKRLALETPSQTMLAAKMMTERNLRCYHSSADPDHQPGANADVGIAALHGHGGDSAANLAHQFHVLGGGRRDALPFWRPRSCFWRSVRSGLGCS